MSRMLAEYLARLATQYVFERAKPFAGSAFASFLRHDIAVEAKKITLSMNQATRPSTTNTVKGAGVSSCAAAPRMQT